MPLLFLIALFAVPYLEFLVFVEVADKVGGLSALMLTIVTAVLGIYIIRQEGIQVLSNLKNTVERGESPVIELIHGFFLAVAGFFFLLPGFITDSIAILLAIAPVRAMLGNMMVDAGKKGRANRPTSTHSSGVIIDGEFTEADEDTTDAEQKIIDNQDDDRKE